MSSIDMGRWRKPRCVFGTSEQSRQEQTRGIRLTVKLPKATIRFELVRRDSQAVVLDGAVPAPIVEVDVDSGCAGIKGVPQQATSHGIERSDGDR